MATTQVLHSASSSSSSPSIIPTPADNDTLCCELTHADVDREEERERLREKRVNNRRDQLSLLAVLLTVFRKRFSLVFRMAKNNLSAGGSGVDFGQVMEIGWPTDVQHVNHVTFDRFDGFLGLPDEFEPEVPRLSPSASATVFGVSTESMQLSYDQRGNSIPTILLLLQRHLYSQGGLQAEGIFRLTAGNSQDEYVREQLNRGIVPEGIDVHCLAGLIKAWFRELPRGVLDSLSPEEVMQCDSEEDCNALVRLLPPTEAALLDWAINLMADVVQQEHLNKMNTRNIAMVFAPNMTQMADPLTALMHAVRVMNFLMTLTEKALRERKDSISEPASTPLLEPSDDIGHQGASQLHPENTDESNKTAAVQTFVVDNPGSDNGSQMNRIDITMGPTPESDKGVTCRTPRGTNNHQNRFKAIKISNTGQSNTSCQTKTSDSLAPVAGFAMKTDNTNKGKSNLSRINSVSEVTEARR